jgi:hypothetical protein
VEALVDLVEHTARLGVSMVLEFVVTPARVDAFRRIEAAASGVVLLTDATDAPARAEARDRADLLLGRAEVRAALGHASIDDYLAQPERDAVRREMRTELGLPTLRVATDDGYDPTFPEIVDWVVEQTRRRDRGVR